MSRFVASGHIIAFRDNRECQGQQLQGLEASLLPDSRKETQGRRAHTSTTSVAQFSEKRNIVLPSSWSLPQSVLRSSRVMAAASADSDDVFLARLSSMPCPDQAQRRRQRQRVATIIVSWY